MLHGASAWGGLLQGGWLWRCRWALTQQRGRALLERPAPPHALEKHSLSDERATDLTRHLDAVDI